MSVGGRALLAVLLTIGFYILALLVVAGLLAIPVAEWVLLGRITPLLLLSTVVFAGLIIWSIFPRRLPSPRSRFPLDPVANHRLFAEVEDVAQLVKGPMLVEISLDFTVNAGVSMRGGVFGIGGRRVMILGLPLLQALRVTELRAVIAHEYGHFLGGDTNLGPWVYRTNATISRTREEVGRYWNLLHMPFSLYARLFQRVTMGISQRQEVLADELAARSVGAGALISALEAMERASIAFSIYWQSAVVPVLESGYLPPITEGFACFLDRRATATAVDAVLAERRDQRRDERYDSHPPLAAREQALRSLPSRSYSASEPRAISLLDRLPELERAVVAGLTGRAAVPPVSIAWTEVGERVVRLQWQRMASEIGTDLQHMTTARLPELIGNAERIGRARARLRGADAWLSKDRATNAGLAALQAALGLALSRDSWLIEWLPGLPVTLRRDGVAVELHDTFDKLASGRLSPTSWQALCAELGIDGLRLDATEA
jgi:heat shock protein HtpX